MSEFDRHDLGPLLDRVARGRDRAALNELLARLRPYLHSVVRQTLGEWQDASDIVQSGLRRIHDHLPELLDDNPTVPHLLAWIKKIVRNRAIDEARRRGRAARPGPDSALNNLPEAETPAEKAARETRSLAVLAALGRLTERQRQVVELHYFDRLRDEEIRERIGGSVAAIRVLRCRALKELRRLMEADHAAQ
jgi:RNA polymerase sigma-70 factor, ECF subfamily